jgi:hypothetical protein
MQAELQPEIEESLKTPALICVVVLIVAYIIVLAIAQEKP